VLALKLKGEHEITAGDIELNSDIELINPEVVLGHLTAKDAEIDIEVKVERGLGYVPVDARKSEGRLPIGTIAIDSIFTPVLKVNYTIEDMRVGDRTDYNRLRLRFRPMVRSARHLRCTRHQAFLGITLKRWVSLK